MNLKFGVEVSPLPNKTKSVFLAIEESGFDTVWMGDHFLPWSNIDAERLPYINYMSLVYLPLILSYTSKIKVGPCVLCPLFRYHPAIVAQYFAQLDWTFPSRVILGLGTGEKINEYPIVGFWPNLKERRERLVEAVKIIRMLWENKDFFDFDGQYYRLKNVKLYVRPKQKIPIIVSAGGSQMAKIAGEIGDGVMAFVAESGEVKNKIINPFYESLKKSGKKIEEAEVYLYTVGGIVDEKILPKILKGLKRTASFIHGEAFKQYDPREVDKVTINIPEDVLFKKTLFVTSVDDLISRIEEYFKVGVNHLVVSDLTSVLEGKTNRISEVWKRKIIPYFVSKKF
ncbi:MAG: hypothetical protein B6U77_02945 [Candidatus Hecatellales archaeon ex4484_218]|nr:MAG: hypothetical protein B6U77_02945 [Candidatus Hecatellales archaeon ex4484_218]